MPKIGQQISERRWYGRFDKKEILKKTKGICARCGIRLNMDTASVEHVIPISRGGWDGPANLVPLCPACNAMKDDLLYIPRWFYTAIGDTPLLDRLTRDFSTWFRETVKTDFPINKYPLISPRLSLQINILMKSGRVAGRKTYIPGNIITWSYIGKNDQEEVQETTGVHTGKLCRTLRTAIDRIPGHADQENEKRPMAAYALRKESTGKILALGGILYDHENRRAAILVPYDTLPSHYRPPILWSLVRALSDALDLGGYGLDDILFLLPDKEENRKTLLTIANEPTQGHALAMAQKRSLYANTGTVEFENPKECFVGIRVSDRPIGEFLNDTVKDMFRKSLKETEKEKNE